jgi:hypothetical protein
MSTSLTTISKSVLALGIGLVMLPGCPLLEIEADVPEVCLHYPNLQVETTKGASSIKQTFVFDDLSAAHDITELDADLEFVRAEVRATSGIEGFAFVRAVKVVVSSGDPASTLPPLTMYDCDGDCVPQDNRLEIPAALGRNAIEYLKSDSIVIDLDFEGEVPAASWTMDVDVCMKARAGYTFSP